MSRPKKTRKICLLPKFCRFIPLGGEDHSPVSITMEEYETLRMIDKDGFSQSECAAYMKVARTTVQEIYAAARHKTASALVEGRPLHIEGGNYRICEGHGTLFACRNCYQRRQASETGGNDNV